MNKVSTNYWENFSISTKDIEYIYSHLFELETPLSTKELTKIIISDRIRIEKEKIQNKNSLDGLAFLPKDDYTIGQKVVFPALNYEKGTITDKRAGNNPDHGNFSVISVEFSNGLIKQFACNLETHKLNQIISFDEKDPALDPDIVYSKYKKMISSALVRNLEVNEEIVQIAGYWFPNSLLIDVNLGYLNLAEAVLEMENGGPLSTKTILEQIELPTDTNNLLTEFSLNYALQEDERFDEVGPSGETLWFLHRLEPENVRFMPKYLIPSFSQDFEKGNYLHLLSSINAEVYDELEDYSETDECKSDVSLSIIYPHWRSGTLPLSSCLEELFPTAYEAPRIRFTFIDGDTGEKFPGWVIRKNRYVYGLAEWYKKNDVLPGSNIHLKLNQTPGEVVVSTGKKRPTREWVRTVSVAADGKITFQMLKQQISTEFDDRMIVAISNPALIDGLWEKYENHPLPKLVPIMVRELAKLNPQGHVHAQELYAAMNVIKRISPLYILHLLNNAEDVEHLGDLYYRIKINQTG